MTTHLQYSKTTMFDTIPQTRTIKIMVIMSSLMVLTSAYGMVLQQVRIPSNGPMAQTAILMLETNINTLASRAIFTRLTLMAMNCGCRNNIHIWNN